MDVRTGTAAGIADRWLHPYVAVGALLLVVGALVGFAVGTFVPADVLTGAAGDSGFLPAEITFTYILGNNLVAVTVMLLGAVSVGTLTVFALLLNGFVVGFVVELALREASALEVVLLIAPHGVLEIPAILLVAAIGLRFGHRTYRYLRGREKRLLTSREIKEAGVLYLAAVVLIVVAAWIEANYTLAIAESLA
jgi:stage II sporulation protein M